MQVWQLMTAEVVTLDADATLDIADDLMTLKRIRHLPIVRAGDLVGLVSQRDLFRAGLSSVLEFRKTTKKEWLHRIPVREVMAQELVTIAPETDMEEAVNRMLDRQIGCLPVVSAGKLVGLLSESDCLRYLQRILKVADVKRRLTEEERLWDVG